MLMLNPDAKGTPVSGDPFTISPPTSFATGFCKVIRKSLYFQRREAARRKREQRLRDDLGRKQVKTTPNHPLLCEALRAFAKVSEMDAGSDKAVAKLINAVRDDVPGWEDDDQLLEAVCTAIVDTWAAEWARNQT